MIAIGMMSGTSLDGIDVALVKFYEYEGKLNYHLIDFRVFPYPMDTLDRIHQVMDVERSNVQLICQLHKELGVIYGNCAKEIMYLNGLCSCDVSFIANHGQTIYHDPQAEFPSTLQIGEPAEIYEITGVPVVSNLREADIAAGGQGAPIVPFTEYALYRSDDISQIFVNIGGISNITVLPKHGTIDSIVAFDTGPGNMMIDSLCKRFFNQPYDDKGLIGLKGEVQRDVLELLLDHPYMNRRYPKTTGREDFGEQYVEELLSRFTYEPQDMVATFTLFTAKSLAKAILEFQELDPVVVIGGGGSYNPTLIQMIREELTGIQVLTQEEFGFSSEAKEAIAMAILGKFTLDGLPNNVPSATGAKHPVVLGRITGR